MKLIKLSAFAACALLLASCGGNKTVKLDKNSTPGDSIGYLFGEMLHSQHISYAENYDTTMKAQKALDSYSEGFEKGLELLKADDDAYNKGLADAMTARQQILGLNKEYDCNITTDALLSGFKANGNKTMDAAAAQKLNTQLNEIVMRLHAQKTAKSAKEAIAKANELAKKKGYKTTGDIRYKAQKEGTGDKLKNGANIKANFTIKDKDGKEVIPATQGSSLTVGNTAFSPLLDKALPMLKVGSVYEFITTPAELFGEQLPPQIDAAEPLYFNIEVVGIDEDATPIELPAEPEVR